MVRTPAKASEASDPGVRPFALAPGGHSATAGPAGGFTPSQLAGAYGYDPHGGGSGQTVAIVDAFDDPNIASDLEQFDSQYELGPCNEANGCFRKVGQTGRREVLPAADKTGWSVEIALDVEAVRGACPNCKILLVEAENTLFTNLAASVNEAASLGATEISNSYGGAEGPSAALENAYNHPGVVIAAATGDLGWDGWVGFPAPERPNVPSSLPTVVSVGGTSLALTESGARASETVWNGNGPLNEDEYLEGVTGGGCSLVFTAQPWQRSVPGYGATGCDGSRLSADVAAVADPLTGFDIFDSYDCGAECERFRDGANWLTIGGTSLSTPLITAQYALAGGADGVAYPALTLYGHLGGSALFDVTQGGNGYCDDGEACGVNAFFEEGLDCEGTTACNAAPGFDGPTGVGTPSSLALFKPLLPAGSITPPAKTVVHQPASFSGSATDPNPGGNASGFGSYAWSWGDGSESSGEAPTHTFSASGEFTVTMTYTDRYGLKAAPVSVKVAVAERSAKEIEEEAVAKKKAEEEAAKKKAEELAARIAEENAQARAAEEAARKAAELQAPSGQGVAGFRSSAEPDATLAGQGLQAGVSGAFTLKISCPAGESSCEGTVTVRTASAVPASAHARVLMLASASFKVAGGKTVLVKLHLSTKARALLKRRHSLRVKVTIAAHDPAGARHSSVVTATLRRHG
jgi:PKD domain/Subtilase family